MLAEINACYPPIFDILKPFFVITIIRRMKIKNIFSYQDKMIDTVIGSSDQATHASAS